MTTIIKIVYRDVTRVGTAPSPDLLQHQRQAAGHSQPNCLLGTAVRRAAHRGEEREEGAQLADQGCAKRYLD